MAARKRFVVEGEWSGYTSGQRRVCHREICTTFRAQYEALKSLRFTDGTELYISVRDLKPRERIEEIKGYSSALSHAVMKGLSGFGVNIMECQ